MLLTKSHLLVMLVLSVLLSACGGDTTDFATLKDQFAYQEQSSFKANELQSQAIHQLTAIQDKELVKSIFKQLYPNESGEYLTWANEQTSLYLYSWQGINGDKRHFTLLHDATDYDTGMDNMSVFYVIADPEGKMLSKKIIADYTTGGDGETVTDAEIKDGTITINFTDLSYNPEDFRNPKNVHTCTIANDSLSCSDIAEIYGLVCLWPNLSVRATPEDEGKYLNAMRLGESALSLGEIKTDENSSKKRQYVDVVLSDGTKGWVREDLVAVNAVAAGVAAKTSIYRRPDPLTVTGDAFQALDLVAIYEKDGDYVKVKGIPRGQSWYKEGWANNEHLWQGANVAVASLYQDAMAEKDPAKQGEKLQNIVDNKEFEEAFLYDVLKKETGIGGSGGGSNAGFSSFMDQFLEVYMAYETEMMSEMGEGKALSDEEVYNWLAEEENNGYDGVGQLKNLGNGTYTGLLVEYSPGSSSNQRLYLFDQQGEMVDYLDIMQIESANAPDQTHIRGRVTPDEVYLEFMRTWWEGDPAEEDSKVNNAYWIKRFEIGEGGFSLITEQNIPVEDFELFDVGGI